MPLRKNFFNASHFCFKLIFVTVLFCLQRDGVLVPIGKIDLDDGVVVAPRTNADTGITFAHVLFLLELMSLLL